MKVYLAEVDNYMPFLSQVNAKYVLQSYHNLAKKQNLVRNGDILLDSGAFTYMNSQTNKVLNWDTYIEQYANYINKHNIKLFFELDIDVLVGLDEVNRLRAKLEALTGKQSIPVWHKARGVDYYRMMCNKYKYISIGGLVIKEITEAEYPILKKMVAYARERGVKVHGLGFTNLKWLPLIKWYSVDSTSWAGVMFDYRKYAFIKGQLKALRIQGFNSKLRDQLLLNNATEWIKFQQYAEHYL